MAIGTESRRGDIVCIASQLYGIATIPANHPKSRRTLVRVPVVLADEVGNVQAVGGNLRFVHLLNAIEVVRR